MQKWINQYLPPSDHDVEILTSNDEKLTASIEWVVDHNIDSGNVTPKWFHEPTGVNIELHRVVAWREIESDIRKNQ